MILCAVSAVRNDGEHPCTREEGHPNGHDFDSHPVTRKDTAMTTDTLTPDDLPSLGMSVRKLIAELQLHGTADPAVRDFTVIMLTEGSPVTAVHVDHATHTLYLA